MVEFLWRTSQSLACDFFCHCCLNTRRKTWRDGTPVLHSHKKGAVTSGVSCFIMPVLANRQVTRIKNITQLQYPILRQTTSIDRVQTIVKAFPANVTLLTRLTFLEERPGAQESQQQESSGIHPNRETVRDCEDVCWASRYEEFLSVWAVQIRPVDMSLLFDRGVESPKHTKVCD